MSKQPSTPGEGFTPGPWYVHTPDPALPFYISSSPENHHSGEVAVLYGKDSGPDARLISAAPDLLEALEIVKDMANAMRGEDFNLGYEQWKKVHDAINKARGE